MMESRICHNWTGLCQVRNEAGLSNNLRLSAFEFMTLILKLLVVPLHETMLSEVKKIHRILNNQFPHKR